MVNVEGSGYVRCNKESYGIWEIVELTAVSSEGWRFKEWSTGETADTILLKVTEHMTITAYFEKAIHFNDFNLEAALRDILKIPEGYIFPSDFTEITELDLSKRNITDISALAYADFSNIVSLNLASNNISDISVLADMRLLDLETLDLSFNKISDIS